MCHSFGPHEVLTGNTPSSFMMLTCGLQALGSKKSFLRDSYLVSTHERPAILVWQWESQSTSEQPHPEAGGGWKDPLSASFYHLHCSSYSISVLGPNHKPSRQPCPDIKGPVVTRLESEGSFCVASEYLCTGKASSISSCLLNRLRHVAFSPTLSCFSLGNSGLDSMLSEPLEEPLSLRYGD